MKSKTYLDLLWRIRKARYDQLCIRDYWAAWAEATRRSGFLALRPGDIP